MDYKAKTMLFAAMMAISFAAGAQKIYENVDKQGEVEFSDQSSMGAKEIEVKPNVIDVTPVKDIRATPPVSSDAAATPDGEEMEPDVIHQGVVGDYDEYRERRRDVLEQGKERLEHKEGTAHVPAHKGTVHRGAHHR